MFRSWIVFSIWYNSYKFPLQSNYFLQITFASIPQGMYTISYEGVNERKKKICLIRKGKDYVHGIWVYKVLDIWKGYYTVKRSLVFMHETVNRGKK